MINEKWIKWEPIKNLVTDYFVYSKKYSNQNLEIFLKCSDSRKKDLYVVFENSVFFYLEKPENCSFLTIDYLSKNYPLSFYSKWNFFKIYNSKHMNLIKHELGISIDCLRLDHFMIADDDTFMDIISSKEPIVTEIESK
jgi:hypothetical protein